MKYLIIILISLLPITGSTQLIYNTDTPKKEVTIKVPEKSYDYKTVKLEDTLRVLKSEIVLNYKSTKNERNPGSPTKDYYDIIKIAFAFFLVFVIFCTSLAMVYKWVINEIDNQRDNKDE